MFEKFKSLETCQKQLKENWEEVYDLNLEISDLEKEANKKIDPLRKKRDKLYNQNDKLEARVHALLDAKTPKLGTKDTKLYKKYNDIINVLKIIKESDPLVTYYNVDEEEEIGRYDYIWKEQLYLTPDNVLLWVSSQDANIRSGIAHWDGNTLHYYNDKGNSWHDKELLRYGKMKVLTAVANHAANEAIEEELAKS